MANPRIHTFFDSPDPDASPLNLIQLFQLASVLVHSEVDSADEFLNVVAQVLEPGPEHRDTLWVVLDSVQRPVALKKWYNGHWRRVYNGMAGEIRGFTGSPGYGPAPSLFDVNGRGNIGLEYDGWHICNGKDGVVDFSDKFIIGAHMNKSPNNTHADYDNGWQTWLPKLDGTGDTNFKTGGKTTNMIQMKNLPPLDNSIGHTNPETNQPETTGLWINGKGWKDDATHQTAQPIVDINYGNTRDHAFLLTKYGADPNANPAIPQEEFPVMPPFYAMAWITFVGYENT